MEYLNFLDPGLLTCSNLLVSVGQTTRQRIIYFYVNEAISMSEHRAPTYQFHLAMVSFTAYCVLLKYYFFTDLGIGVP